MATMPTRSPTNRSTSCCRGPRRTDRRTQPNISDASGIGTTVLDSDLDGGFGEPVLRVIEVTGTTLDLAPTAR